MNPGRHRQASNSVFIAYYYILPNFMEEILAMAYRIIGSFFVFCLAIAAGCTPKPRPAAQQAIDFTQPLPDGQLALRKISPSEYPDFSKSLGRTNLANLRQSVQNSLAYLSRASSQTKYPYLDITHDRAVASLQAMLALIDGGGFAQPSQQFNQMIADRFEVYQSIGRRSRAGADIPTRFCSPATSRRLTTPA